MLGAATRAGHADGALLGPGAGDNAAAALGLGAGPGDVVVSIGTSGSSARSPTSPPPTRPARGRLRRRDRPLPAAGLTLNASRVLDAAARLLGVGHAELSRLALSAPSGADGLVLVPYLEGERTPNRPDATGALHGLTLATSTPAHLARAAVEGLLCGLADGLDAVAAQGAASAGCCSSAVARGPRRSGARPRRARAGRWSSRHRGVRRRRRRPAGGLGARRRRRAPVWVRRRRRSTRPRPTRVRERYAEVRDMTARRP